jgi:F0F1-type ATP synthase delta subunit
MNVDKLAKYLIANPDKVSSFLDLVHKYKIEMLLTSLRERIGKMIRSEELRSETKLITARKIDNELKKKIEANYQTQIVNHEVDNELIAGFKMYTRDKFIDASFSNLIKSLV